jgi:hypothetical protein
MIRLPAFHERKKLAVVMVMAQIALWAWYGQEILSLQHQHWRSTFSLLFSFVIWLWYWKLSRLFRLFERGLIFAAETIRCFKILALLCVIGWILALLIESLPGPPFPSHAALPPGATIVHTSVSHFGFFSFEFGIGVNFGLLFVGITIFLIAWIMDEGRKIQEEQELTV